MVHRFKPRQVDTYFNITVRTAQKKFWLKNEDVKIAWENKLAQLVKAYYVKVFSQTIMSNHIHLILKVSHPPQDCADLKKRFEYLESTLISRRKWHEHWQDRYYERFTDVSCFMRDLNQWIAAWHNKKKKTTGHLWGAAFSSKVVGDDQYLLTALAYNDLNAVRAGIVKRAGDFKYCTAGKLQAALDRGETPDFPAVGFLTHIKDQHRAEAYLLWLDYLAWNEKNPYSERPSLESFAEAIETEGIDMSAIEVQILNKEPTDKSKPVFANNNFAREILEREGWNPGTRHREEKEPVYLDQGMKT